MRKADGRRLNENLMRELLGEINQRGLRPGANSAQAAEVLCIWQSVRHPNIERNLRWMLPIGMNARRHRTPAERQLSDESPLVDSRKSRRQLD